MTKRNDNALFDYFRDVEYTENGCWVLTRQVPNANGYVKVKVQDEQIYLHRLFYQAFKGALKEGYEIHHACYNRACCNPQHLEQVTPAENIFDADSKCLGKINRDKTHCKNGHDFDIFNTYYHGPDKRWRKCRTCHREQEQARRAAPL